MQSTDEKINNFLEETRTFNEEHYKILEKLRELVFTINSETKERMMYGGIMFTLTDDFGGIFASKKHVSFEFTKGFTFNDEEKLLEGTGKFRRHLKIKTLEDIEIKKVDYFVKQAIN